MPPGMSRSRPTATMPQPPSRLENVLEGAAPEPLVGEKAGLNSVAVLARVNFHPGKVRAQEN